jgi:hypothetical protein
MRKLSVDGLNPSTLVLSWSQMATVEREAKSGLLGSTILGSVAGLIAMGALYGGTMWVAESRLWDGLRLLFLAALGMLIMGVVVRSGFSSERGRSRAVLAARIYYAALAVAIPVPTAVALASMVTFSPWGDASMSAWGNDGVVAIDYHGGTTERDTEIRVHVRSEHPARIVGVFYSIDGVVSAASTQIVTLGKGFDLVEKSPDLRQDACLSAAFRMRSAPKPGVSTMIVEWEEAITSGEGGLRFATRKREATVVLR